MLLRLGRIEKMVPCFGSVVAECSFILRWAQCPVRSTSVAHRLQKSLWQADAGVEKRPMEMEKDAQKSQNNFFPLWLSFEDFSRRPWNLEISHTGHIVYTRHKSEQHFCSWVQVAEIVLSSRGRQTGTVPSLISSGFCASALDKRRLWRRVGGLKGMLRMGFEN